MAGNIEQAAEATQLKAANTQGAQQLIDVGIPARILELHEIHESLKAKEKAQSQEEPSLDDTDSPTFGTGPTDEVNAEVYALFMKVKALVLRLVEDLGVLKLFVRLASPAVADENFNSQVQEDVLEVISSSRSAGLMVLQHICKYFVERAHYIVKCKKYPLVMDFRKAVEQMDGQQLVSLTESVQGIRNNYLLILDKIIKNRDRLDKAAKGPDRHSSHMVC